MNFFIKRAISTGSKKPLLVNCVKGSFKYSNTVSILAALEASYTVKSFNNKIA